MNARDAGDLTGRVRDAVEQERRACQVDKPDQDRQEHRDPERELDQTLAGAPTPTVLTTGHGVTVTVLDMLAVPPRFETTRTIVYVPWLLYVWDGFWSVDTDDDPAPSPKFHDQASVQPAVVVE